MPGPPRAAAPEMGAGHTPDGAAPDDNTLDYMDQASFLGLRALGHGPLIQFTWVYDRAVDLDGLQRFRRNLGHGLLGRRVERSPLPFGRHHWVSWPGSPEIDLATEPLPPDRLVAWADAHGAQPIDPEHGPSWRMGVTPLTDGGAAVTLVVSHTVADGVGAMLAVADAANGVTHDFGYPPPGTVTKWAGLRHDSRRFVGDIPEILRAVVSAARLARSAPKPDKQPAREVLSDSPIQPGTVTVQSVIVHVPTEQWDAVANSLGGTSNSLLTGFVARLGRNSGWFRDGQPAKLSIPVNQRVDGDTRGNALNAVTLPVDDAVVTGDLTGVRAQLKAQLTGLAEAGHELLGPLPLTPLIPRILARRIESMVADEVIGCSNIGELDPAALRPDGTDAVAMSMRLTENLTRTDLRITGGVFFGVLTGRAAGALAMGIGFTDSAAATTRDEVVAVVQRTLDDFGLSGTIR